MSWTKIGVILGATVSGLVILGLTLGVVTEVVEHVAFAEDLAEDANERDVILKQAVETQAGLVQIHLNADAVEETEVRVILELCAKKLLPPTECPFDPANGE